MRTLALWNLFRATFYPDQVVIIMVIWGSWSLICWHRERCLKKKQQQWGFGRILCLEHNIFSNELFSDCASILTRFDQSRFFFQKEDKILQKFVPHNARSFELSWLPPLVSLRHVLGWFILINKLFWYSY